MNNPPGSQKEDAWFDGGSGGMIEERVGGQEDKRLVTILPVKIKFCYSTIILSKINPRYYFPAKTRSSSGFIKDHLISVPSRPESYEVALLSSCFILNSISIGHLSAGVWNRSQSVHQKYRSGP